jgi:DnaK suppressor protein
MARRDALLRLHKHLMARRNELRKALAGELADLRGNMQGNLTGDAADAAFDTGSDEITSQLAQMEARELSQVERAIARLKQGTFGVCEMCGKKITVARLNALPYSTYCIECQREVEQSPNWTPDYRGGDWEKVYDVEAPLEERRDEVDLSDIEMDLSGNGR